MKRYMAWDIETCPTANALLEPYPETRQPPANYSKPEAISEWFRKDRAAWETDRIKEYSFSARTGRIVALSLNYKGKEHTDLTALDANDEKALIEAGLSMMTDVARVDCCVGFNSKSFDFPFLMLRALYHRVDVEALGMQGLGWSDWYARYSKRNIDVRDLVNFGDWKAHGTLSDWGAWAGEGVKRTSGSMIWEWVQTGNVDEIAAHCREDARLTGVVFERVYPLYSGS